MKEYNDIKKRKKKSRKNAKSKKIEEYEFYENVQCVTLKNQCLSKSLRLVGY